MAKKQRKARGRQGRRPNGVSAFWSIVYSDVDMERKECNRRRLPNWRIPDSLYFLTFRVQLGQMDLKDEEKTCIVDCFKFFNQNRYDLYAYVVMNDHCHVIVQPFAGNAVGKIAHSWRSFSAHELQRKSDRSGSIWQKNMYDRIIRGEIDLEEKSRYIVENPWRRYPALRSYRWVGVKEWLYGGVVLTDRHIRPDIDFLP